MNTNIITGETRIEDMQSRNVLEREYIKSFKTTITPNVINVLNIKFLELKNTIAISISDFINGSPGQRLHILGDGFTTIQNGILIFTNTAANKLLLNNIVYKFTFFPIEGPPKTHKWVEDL